MSVMMPGPDGVPATAVQRDAPRATRVRWALLLGAALVVLASRVPFIGAGYGSDGDAWRVVLSARAISALGSYTASRLPGYPLQEFLYSLIWKGGPWALNGCTAVLSAAAFVFFALAMKRTGTRDYVLAGLALVFVPIVYVSSTNSMDYVWALAFVMAGLYFTLSERPLLAGVSMGVAIGCRITSGAMLVPLSLLLLGPGARSRIVRLLKLWLPAGIIGAACFLPVLLTYGARFLWFWESGYPSLFAVVNKATLEVWGVLGILAILLVVAVQLVLAVRRRTRGKTPDGQPGRRRDVAAIVAIVLYSAAFLRLPHEAGYLVPAIPFVIYLASRWLSRPLFVALCVALIASPFMLSVGTTDRPWLDPWGGRQGGYTHKVTLAGRELGIDARGPILMDSVARRDGLEYVREVLRTTDRLKAKSVVVVGPWIAQVEVEDGPPKESPVFVYLLNDSLAQRYGGSEYSIYYLPKQREYNLSSFGIDLEKLGAELLPLPTR